jgi:hypothetical protein
LPTPSTIHPSRGLAAGLPETYASAAVGVSAEFADVWARHEVAVHTDQRKTVMHPELGRIEVDCQVLHTEVRGQRLLVFTAAPGTVDAVRLALLAVVGRQFAG